MKYKKSDCSKNEEERRLAIRKKWQKELQFYRKHEERKKKMIKQFEEKRAEELKKSYKDVSQKSKNRDNEDHSRTIVKKKQQIANFSVDEDELLRTKVTILKSCHSISRDPNKKDIDNIVIPRRKEEGRKKLFDGEEIKAKSAQAEDEEEEERRIVRIVNNEIGKKLDEVNERLFSKKNHDNHHRREEETNHYRDYQRIYSKQRDADKDRTRSRSSSRYSRHTSSSAGDRLSSQRSRSSPCNSKYDKKRHIDEVEHRSTSRTDYSNSHERDNYNNLPYNQQFQNKYSSTQRPILWRPSPFPMQQQFLMPRPLPVPNFFFDTFYMPRPFPAPRLSLRMPFVPLRLGYPR